ncbi:Uncharacterized protein QTN25_008807 [Entamoeba marina]
MNPNQNQSNSNPITSAPPPIDRNAQQQQGGYQPYNYQPVYQSYGQQPHQQQPQPQPQQPQQQMYQRGYNQQSMFGEQQSSYQAQPLTNISDVSYLQQLIEQYLQLYYTDDEIITELEKKNVAPETTLFILQKLKEQNPNYFKAYEIRLTIKSQINRFNLLIQRHMMTNSNNQNDQMFGQDMYNEYGSYASGPYQGDQSMGGM